MIRLVVLGLGLGVYAIASVTAPAITELVSGVRGGNERASVAHSSTLVPPSESGTPRAGSMSGAADSEASAGVLAMSALHHPTPTPAADVEPWQTVRVIPYWAWSVLNVEAPGREYELARIAYCESGLDPSMRGFDPYDGDAISGAFSTKDRFHGPAPEGFAAQVREFLAIELKAARMGVGDPWAATRKGCARWSR